MSGPAGTAQNLLSTGTAACLRLGSAAGRGRRHLLDLILIASMALAVEGGRFAVRQGRAVVCADSMQYLEGAEALRSGQSSPGFAFRKPGYSIFLALIQACLGTDEWKVVLVQHGLHVLMVLGAYLMGCVLGGHRMAGWLGALTSLAVHGELVWADRIMSETLYAALLMGGVISVLLALRPLPGMEPRVCRDGFPAGLPDRRVWWVCAGCFLALAWLTRASATPVIVAVFLSAATALRRQLRRFCGACAALALPLMMAGLVECGLNLAGSARFRPGTGTLGPMLLMRTRSLEGQDWPDHPSVPRCTALLPERTFDAAYRAHPLDAWVARARAIRHLGMMEWQVNDLLLEVALAGILEHPGSYLATTSRIAFRHLARLPAHDGDFALSGSDSAVWIREDGVTLPDAEPWYVRWATPHLSEAESAALADRLRAFETSRAPFTDQEPFRTLRYLVMNPSTAHLGQPFLFLRYLFPPLALLGFWAAGADRRMVLFLAAACVLDAVLAGLTGASPDALNRFQDVWAGVDAALAAGCIGLTATRFSAWGIRGRGRRPLREEDASGEEASGRHAEPMRSSLRLPEQSGGTIAVIPRNVVQRS